MLANDWGGDGRDVPERPVATPAPAKRSGWWPSAAVHTPLSLAILSEDDIDQAALLMTGLDLDVGVGRRVGTSSRLAWELTFGLRSTLGVVDRFRTQPWDPELPESVEGHAMFLLPLGLCFDWLPEASSGVFGSLHLGFGTFQEPEYMRSGNLAIASRIAGDLGWVLPLEGSSLALSARYSLLGLKRFYIDEAYNSALQLHELSFGVAWYLN